MGQKTDIKEGYSMDYLIHSFFGIGIGILLFLVHYMLAIAVIIFGALLLLTKTGIIIDPDNRKAWVYRSILGFKFGNTVHLDAFKKVRLKYTNEATKMQSRGPSNTIRTKTYSILLFTQNKKIILHEFTEYKLAKKVIDLLIAQLGYTAYDDIVMQKESVKRKITNSRRKL